MKCEGQLCRRTGYSLIEVLIAAGILLTGIAAAAMMAHSMFLQLENNGRITRGLNLQEQAARLWQLGVSTSTIAAILPEKCIATNPPGVDAVYLSNATGNFAISGLGTVETNRMTIVFHAATAANGSLIYQTNAITVVRPSIR